jgi:hypothetical protein
MRNGIVKTTKLFNKNTCNTASSNCGFKARSGSTMTAAAEELSIAVLSLETRTSISVSPFLAAALMNNYEQFEMMLRNSKRGTRKKCSVEIHLDFVSVPPILL